MFGSFFLPDEKYSPPKTSTLGPGKLQGRESAVTPGTPHIISSLSSASTQEGALSVFCRFQRRSFLVDSGADVSVFPASPAQRLSGSSSASFLQAANGTSIRAFGKKSLKLSFRGLKNVRHSFLLADVRRPVLGSDFFRQQRLVIDISRRRLFCSLDATSPVVEIRAKSTTFDSSLCGL